MPTYTYRCLDCGTVEDYLLPLDGAPKFCIACEGSRLEKKITAPNINTNAGSQNSDSNNQNQDPAQNIVDLMISTWPGRVRTIRKDSPDGGYKSETTLFCEHDKPMIQINSGRERIK